MDNPEILTAVTTAFSVLFKGKNFVRLLGGLGVTIWIAAVSVFLSIFLGFLFGIVMNVKNRAIRWLCHFYLEFMRIMPQMVLLFLAYFGITHAFGISISGEAASVLVFTLWGTAEMADLVRGSLLSIPMIQYESSKALGFSRLQTYIYIIIPQVARRLLPLSINLITRMIKTTSLIMMIGIVEVLKTGQQIIEANRKTSPGAAFGIFATIFLLYFLACWPISCLSKYLEKRWEN